jgi:hypothetical protein
MSLPTEKQIAKYSKKWLKENWPDSDEFVADVHISLPEEAARKLNVWLNLQHTGKRILGRDAIIADAHKEAAYQLHKCRSYRMKFRIDMNGNWIFIGFE